MNPYGTLEFLRRISGSGAISEIEAMDLAEYLNEHQGARHSWPGNMLFNFLVSVYEDGSMRDYELQALAHVIQGVLVQADGMAAEGEANEPVPVEESEAPDGTLLLPDLSALDKLGLNGGPAMPDVFFANMQCDCLDWQTVRRKLPPNSPGRICRHLGRHLFANRESLPTGRTNLRRLVVWSGEKQRALPPQPNWQVVPVDGQSLIFAWGSGRLCWVFAPDRSGKVDQYAYDLREQHWSNYQRPAQYLHEDLKAFLATLVAGAEPDQTS